jgi:hypothetical protein
MKGTKNQGDFLAILVFQGALCKVAKNTFEKFVVALESFYHHFKFIVQFSPYILDNNVDKDICPC